MEQVQPSIEEINEVIGIFMGGKWADKKIVGRNQKRFYYNDIPFAFVKDTTSLNYHKDWNELMPVVDNISEIYNNSFCVTIRTNLWCTIEAVTQQSIAYDIEFSEINEKGDNIHQSVYHACYKFIQWYNQQKQSI